MSNEDDEEPKNAATFITLEGLKNRKLDPTDEAVIESAKTGKGLIAATPESLEHLIEAARYTHDLFRQRVKALMTEKRAEFVRKCRVDDNMSWRAVASACYLEFEVDSESGWEPPSNQIAGMALCEAAAALYDQDYMSEPWN